MEPSVASRKVLPSPPWLCPGTDTPHPTPPHKTLTPILFTLHYIFISVKWICKVKFCSYTVKPGLCFYFSATQSHSVRSHQKTFQVQSLFRGTTKCTVQISLLTFEISKSELSH